MANNYRRQPDGSPNVLTWSRRFRVSLGRAGGRDSRRPIADDLPASYIHGSSTFAVTIAWSPSMAAGAVAPGG